jgi:hypothetical protein
VTKLAFILAGTLAGAWFGCAKPRVVETPIGDGCDGRFAFHETKRSARGASVSVESRCHVPATLDLMFHSLINLVPDRERPIRVFLQPGEIQPFVDLRVKQAGADWRYGVEYLHAPGRLPARHDDAARYAFPYGGSEPRLCVQGEHGRMSHWGRIAFDFVMPVGTPVLAAREGIVFATIDGFDEGQPEAEFQQRVNLVVVLHADDTVARYGHLRRGIPVSEGDRVVTGQLLGYSGNSGYSTGPHLHFEVDVPEMHGVESIPIRFVGDAVPSAGQTYPPTAEVPVTTSEAAPPQETR